MYSVCLTVAVAIVYLGHPHKRQFPGRQSQAEKVRCPDLSFTDLPDWTLFSLVEDVTWTGHLLRGRHFLGSHFSCGVCGLT